MIRWLQTFLPAPVHVRWQERLRACLGALFGIALTGASTRFLIGASSSLPLLIAPMGASAVLLFAVPSSPLAQPWSVIGGNLAAAVIGVTCAKWIGNPFQAAAIAVAVSIGAMFALRCLHPPSGAVALTTVLGGPAVQAAGYGFVLEPVAINSLLLVTSALAYHFATGHRYPHTHQTRPHAAIPMDGLHTFTRSDLEAVLKDRRELLDIDTDDLEDVLRDATRRSLARR
jgi:CBS domain-containing membrane protein